jgi:hypothetical protein
MAAEAVAENESANKATIVFIGISFHQLISYSRETAIRSAVRSIFTVIAEKFRASRDALPT